MNRKILFGAIMAMTVFAFTNCAEDHVLDGGDMNLHFDKNDITIDASESTLVVKILDAEEEKWTDAESWGVSHVEIKSETDTSYFQNTFKEETNGKGDTYNVYENQLKGDNFLIDKKGAEIHILIKENDEIEHVFTVSINAGGKGYGDIRITQKGK
jgi:hypothetical protein